MVVTVTVKCNSGTKFDVSVELSKTVKEFKEMIVGQAGVSAGQMRLIHRGHVLKDGSTLESYGVCPILCLLPDCPAADGRRSWINNTPHKNFLVEGSPFFVSFLSVTPCTATTSNHSPFLASSSEP